MELYIGGSKQGKLKYVLNKKRIDNSSDFVCDGEYCLPEEVLKKPILYNFHLFIKRYWKSQEDIEPFILDMQEQNPLVSIVCNEVGYGIVPIDKEERTYREMVGRTCCKLAECADEVERIVCGMGLKLK